MSTELLSRGKPQLPVANRCPNCHARAIGGVLLCGCRRRGPGQIGGPIEVTGKDYERTLNKHAAINGRAAFTKEEIAAEIDRINRRLAGSKDPQRSKEDYYIYDTRPYRMKDAPTLNPELALALRNERLDKKFRFVWGGVVLVREEENSDFYTIARGDKTAIRECNGVMMPKYIYARALQARGYCYYDDLNRKVAVTREEFIPAGRISRVDYRYVDFGILRWFLERRSTGQELVDARLYDPKERVPEHEWVCVMKLETKAGYYYEPGLEMIEVLQKREWEDKHADLEELAVQQMVRDEEARIAAEEADEAAGAKEFDLVYQDALRSVLKKTVYSN